MTEENTTYKVRRPIHVPRPIKIVDDGSGEKKEILEHSRTASLVLARMEHNFVTWACDDGLTSFYCGRYFPVPNYDDEAAAYRAAWQDYLKRLGDV